MRRLLYLDNLKVCRLVTGTGAEVNPESWTQLKGSNETEF